MTTFCFAVYHAQLDGSTVFTNLYLFGRLRSIWCADRRLLWGRATNLYLFVRLRSTWCGDRRLLWGRATPDSSTLEKEPTVWSSLPTTTRQRPRYVDIVFHCCLQCCGSVMFIPDPGSEFFPSRILDPGSKRFRIRIRIEEFKHLTQKFF
jgi:hypothetical protein